MTTRLIATAILLILGGLGFFGVGIYHNHLLFHRMQSSIEDVGQLTEQWATLSLERTQALAADERVRAELNGTKPVDINILRATLYEYSYLEKVDDLFIYSPNLTEQTVYPATTTALTSAITRLLAEHLQEAQTGDIFRLMRTPKGPMLLLASPILEANRDQPLGMAAMMLKLDQALLTHQRPVLYTLPDAETLLLDQETSKGPILILHAFDNLPAQVLSWPASYTERVQQKDRGLFDLDVPRLVAGYPSTIASGWTTLLTLSQDQATSQISTYKIAIGGGTLALILLIWLPLLMHHIQEYTSVDARKQRLQNKRDRKSGKKTGRRPHNDPKRANESYLDYRTSEQRRKHSLNLGAHKKHRTTPIKKAKSPERKMADVIETSLKQNRTHLLFQPIFDSYTREVLMHEVFLRIEDDNGDIITPDKFIPIAQRYRLLPKIDGHVIIRVIEEYLDPEVTLKPLAVNLGGGTFESFAFLQTLMARIRPEWSENLILELRSQEIIRDAKAMEFIHNCRKLGCRFSIDYFGGGSAMLSGTKRMQFNYLKLDSLSFQGTEEKKELIRLARQAQKVDLPLILERVEHEEDVILAQKAGIPYVQGYFMAIPDDKLKD